MKIYHNPRCSKSRQTLKILETENIKFQIINYIKTGVTIKEIYEIISKLKVDPINIVRTQEKVWKTEYNKNMKIITEEFQTAKGGLHKVRMIQA